MMVPDWIDLIRLMGKADARFLVVGAHALAVHGVLRATQDLDLWIEPTRENAARVGDALVSFGALMDDMGVALDDLAKPNRAIQIGIAPNRIDIVTSLSGLASFDDAWNGSMTHPLEGVEVRFLGRAALVANKRATGRRKDLADLEALGELPPL